ncbi:hypothetical protein K6L59_02840, partial [Candidatus Phytoplasma sp. Tabriz.2]|nr:hypothetical protein [Candidatus Phytoplasma australiense]
MYIIYLMYSFVLYIYIYIYIIKISYFGIFFLILTAPKTFHYGTSSSTSPLSNHCSVVEQNT